jgi:hypothetical protein
MARMILLPDAVDDGDHLINLDHVLYFTRYAPETEKHWTVAYLRGLPGMPLPVIKLSTAEVNRQINAQEGIPQELTVRPEGFTEPHTESEDTTE